MAVVIEKGASDLHLNPGRPPVIRHQGELVSIPGTPVLDDATNEQLCRALCTQAQWDEVARVGTTDFGIAHESGNRFRASVFRQRGRYSAVLRLIPNRLLSFDQIGLPEAAKEVLRRPRGLVLVTGPTGSGKTTTLATMIDWINQNLDRHIITIEDPIEYYHSHKKSLVTQRELGADVPSFPEALRRALRQDPDVILLGEMRDLDTISAAITAAETGHLVFGTLHTTGSARTVDRIIDAYPTNQQEQVRAQLSVSIVAVISQVLLPRKDKRGRVAGFEIMLMTPAIGNLIRKNETNKIQSTLQTSRRMGMITLDDFLLDLVKRDVVSREVALDAAQDPKDLEARL
ncbi:MAG: type IV pilus twitching motility protein PilT [Planctomycetes bacterium]|jgi:twitching motility protein PilT|nr:type IV pilus twitching motility protein PilT [Planctomycetota bacterium]